MGHTASKMMTETLSDKIQSECIGWSHIVDHGYEQRTCVVALACALFLKFWTFKLDEKNDAKLVNQLDDS